MKKTTNKGIHNPISSQHVLNFKIFLGKKSLKGIHNPIFPQPFLNFIFFLFEKKKRLRESIILSYPSLFAYLRKTCLRDSLKKHSFFFIILFFFPFKKKQQIRESITLSSPSLFWILFFFIWENKSFKGIHNPIFSQPGCMHRTRMHQKQCTAHSGKKKASSINLEELGSMCFFFFGTCAIIKHKGKLIPQAKQLPVKIDNKLHIYIYIYSPHNLLVSYVSVVCKDRCHTHTHIYVVLSMDCSTFIDQVCSNV